MAKPTEEGKQSPAADQPVSEIAEKKVEEPADVCGSDAVVAEAKTEATENATVVEQEQEKPENEAGDGNDKELSAAVEDEPMKEEKSAEDDDKMEDEPPKNDEDKPAGDESAKKEKSPSVDLGLDDLVLSSLDVYDLANYTFGRKDRLSRSIFLRSADRAAAVEHYRARFDEHGLRRSVAAVLLVHLHRFAHILLLQRSDGSGGYALPGGRLRPGESYVEGLERKLARKLTSDDVPAGDGVEIGELLSTWYRIEFGGNFYPYLPAHLSAPKEELHMYTVCLPETFAFSVPKNMQLIAIPVYDLFENTDVYGNVIAAVPSLLSRFHKNYC